MLSIIVGTAGHIDHGKTALVRALTGIETDRLQEEKRRGISIDLGFAHLDLEPGLRLGFVDVPGHERFVRNMLAGAAGIDVVLLVVAADESIKPQTREHFDICRLLNVKSGVVAVTKADLVERDLVDLVRLEVEDFVAGSFLEGAPVVPVSSVTGQGLDELRLQLARIARQVRRKDASRHFRLPVDRAFSMRGFGTVVTGTLVSGSVAMESEVELHPGGRRLRVRGVQVHGETVERAVAGQRTALNLSGADVSDFARGMTLAGPGVLRSSSRIDSVFHLLPSAKPMKHRAPIHFHAGTAEVEAEVRLLEGGEAQRPGSSAYVRFLLREPLLLLPGDRFIARMFSPVLTIGGGEVLDPFPPERLRKDAAGARLALLHHGSTADKLALMLGDSPFGASLADMAARSGLSESDVAAAPGFLLARLPQPWILSAAWAHDLLERARKALAGFHAANPLLPGMPKEELRSRLLEGAPVPLLDALLGPVKDIVAEGENLRLASHNLSLKRDEEAALARIEAAFRDAGLAVPATADVLSKSGVSAAQSRSLLQILLRRRSLVRVGEELVFHREAIESLRALLAPHKGRRFSVPEFKDWTGISRKYAIPLLEYLDRERITLRQGDARIVL